MKYLIDKLRSNRRLDAEEYKALLLCRDTELAAYLQELAREEALARFGNKIFIRGLIEITNRCRNNCYYCGIRKENRNITRYELAQEEILSCCHEGYRLGFRTFVLQGGEAPAVKDEGMVETVAAIRQSFPDCAITLSLGEKSREAYERFFLAGANRYLLRHETLQRRALSPASSCGDVPFPSVAMLGLAERDRLSSGNRNHGGQSLSDGGPFGRRHSLHRTVSAGDDRHGTFSSTSRYSVFLFSAGRYGVDVEVAFYLPVDASRGTDTCYHCPGHTCSGRTGTGNIGWRQCRDA